MSLRCHVSGLVAAVVSALVGSAQAAPPVPLAAPASPASVSVPIGFDHLVKKSISLDLSKSFPGGARGQRIVGLVAPRCQLALDATDPLNATLTSTPGGADDCAAVWSWKVGDPIPPLTLDTLTFKLAAPVTVQLVPPKPVEAVGNLSYEDKVVKPSSSLLLLRGMTVYYRTARGYQQSELPAQPPTEVEANIKARLKQIAYVVVDGAGKPLASLSAAVGGNQWATIAINPVDPAPPAGQVPTCEGARPGDSYLICIDMVHGGKVVFGSATSPILRPNRSVIVRVFYPAASKSARIEMGGVRGITTPGFDTGSGTPVVQSAAPESPPLVTEAVFGPRRPGSADVTVTVTPKDGDVVTKIVELTVEPTYVGAIRVGIAGVFGPGIDRTYEARRINGSSQYEISSASFGAASAELLLGFAPFFDEGGRGALSGCQSSCIAPYLGLGLVNLGASGIEAFKSVHLGVEYEINPSFSIALTAAGRRVTRLADGYKIGSALPDATVPTKMGIDGAFGLVLNVSPEFLRIARASVSNFTKLP